MFNFNLEACKAKASLEGLVFLDNSTQQALREIIGLVKEAGTEAAAGKADAAACKAAAALTKINEVLNEVVQTQSQNM